MPNPALTLTDAQQQAVARYAAHVDNQARYDSPTLATAVHRFLAVGNWAQLIRALPAVSAPVRDNFDRFFLAICSYIPTTLWQMAEQDADAVTTLIHDQIETDDSCPFRHTADYINSFCQLNGIEQQAVIALVEIAIPGFHLEDVICNSILPAASSLAQGAVD